MLIGGIGSGKTYVAWALVHEACLEGHSAVHRRLPNLLREITIARADGSYPKKWPPTLRQTSSPWMTGVWTRLSREQALDLLDLLDLLELLELLEDRHSLKSTLVSA